MSMLFEHESGTASNAEHLTVQSEGNFLLFDGQAPGNYGDDVTRVRVDRDAVLRLHAALGEWLYPVHTPEAENRSLIEQLIDKAAKDAVTAILPLHLAPAADRWGYVDATPNPYATQSSPGLCRDCGDTRPSLALYHACTADMPDRPFDDEDAPELCNIPGCMITGMPGTHFAHDPQATDPCDTDCANRLCGDHCPRRKILPGAPACSCHDADSNSILPDVRPATLWEAELRRDAGKSIPLPYCGACGHSRIRHDSGRCSVRHCLCNWDGKP